MTEHKLRYIRCEADCGDTELDRARTSALHRHGDMLLVWANEGDLIRLGQDLSLPPMTLDEALEVLAYVHTGDDSQVGFHIYQGGPDGSEASHRQYAEAWKTVRMHLHMQVNPSPTPTEDAG